jgi:CDP-glycerol glycerophosphotransferase (TagB/SpsB family)
MKLNNLRTHATRAIDYGVMKACSLLPIKERTIVLHSIPDFSDSTHEFYEYMRREHAGEGYTLVWLTKDPSKYADYAAKNIHFVRSEGKGLLLKRDYWLSVCKFAIFTHSAPIRKWRKEQIFIDTTHGASRLKGDDIRPKDEARIIVPNYRLRSGRNGLEKLMRLQKLPRDKYVIVGIPRTDILFRHRDCLSLLFPDAAEFKLTAIAMETFKQNHKGWIDSSAGKSYGLNVISSAQELAELDAFLREKGVLLLIKPHPLQDLSYIEMNSLGNIRFITDRMLEDAGIQLYELVENCGTLLTDYSSIYYEYLLLDRPIGFLIGDMEDYTRGFVIPNPLDEMTGPKINSMETLKGFFEDVLAGRDDYVEARNQLKDDVFKYKDGKNCQRLYDFMKSLAKDF